MADKDRIVVTFCGAPLAVYELIGPGEGVLITYCDQTGPVPAYKEVELADLESWLAEQLKSGLRDA